MQKATKCSRGPELGEKEANYVESEEDEATTAAKCVLRIEDKAVSIIIDSGAVDRLSRHHYNYSDVYLIYLLLHYQ